MRRHAVHTLRSIRASAAWLALYVALYACGGESIVPMPLGQSIPIADYRLTVQRVQPAPKPGPPISTFREQPGREGIMVFVSWAGLDALDAMSRIAFAQKFLEDRLAVVDSTGERHEPTAAMQSALLYMNDPGDNWRDWIVLFHLPVEGDGWDLEVENPEPVKGQPSRFAIDLGG
jgi:hypothetical protein